MVPLINRLFNYLQAKKNKYKNLDDIHRKKWRI
nr:MAG TPA: two-partite extracellular sensor domain protein [Caudoviricetes sp.]